MDAVTGQVRRIRAKRAPDDGWEVSTRLTPASQTDPVDNRGASLSSRDSRREMREIQENLAADTPEKVPQRLRSMKRLWEGKGLAGLLIRREQEAVFFERGLECDCWE